MGVFPKSFLRDAVQQSLAATSDQLSTKLDELQKNIEEYSQPLVQATPLPFKAPLPAPIMNSSNVDTAIDQPSFTAPVDQSQDFSSQLSSSTDPSLGVGNPLSTDLPTPYQAPTDLPTPDYNPLDNGDYSADTGPGNANVRKLSPVIQEAAQKFNVPASIIAGISDIESGGRSVDDNGNPLRSSVGAMGPMQVMPFHFKEGENGDDLRTNIMKGTQILADNYRQYGSWDKAAAAYFGALRNGEITDASDGGTTGSGYVAKFNQARNQYGDLDAGDNMNIGNSRGNFNVPDQMNSGFTQADAIATCGIVLATAFARANGRDMTEQEALELAKAKGYYDSNSGMHGPEAEVKFLKDLGVDAHTENGADWNKIQKDIQAGNPVGLSTANHYWGIDDYNPQTGKYHVGNSGKVYAAGSDWMTADQIQSIGGGSEVSIFADSPLSGGLSHSNTVKDQNIQPGENVNDYGSRLGDLLNSGWNTLAHANDSGVKMMNDIGTSLIDSPVGDAVKNTFESIGSAVGDSYNSSALKPMGDSLYRDVLDPSTGAFGEAHHQEREQNLATGNYGELAKNVIGEPFNLALNVPTNAILAGLQSAMPGPMKDFKPINFTPDDPDKAFGLTEVLANVVLPATAAERAGLKLAGIAGKAFKSVGEKLVRDGLEVTDAGRNIIASIQDLNFPGSQQLTTAGGPSIPFRTPIDSASMLLDRPTVNWKDTPEIGAARTDLHNLTPSAATDVYGGATFDTKTGLHYDPAAGGYAVSRADGVKTLIVKDRSLLDNAIQKFTDINQDVLNKGDVFLGVWKKVTSKGDYEWHIDATTVHDDPREALAMTWERREAGSTLPVTHDFNKNIDTPLPRGILGANSAANPATGKIGFYTTHRGEKIGIDSALEWAQYRQYDRLLASGDIQDYGKAGLEYTLPYLYTDPKSNGQTVIKYFSPDSWYIDREGKFILNETKSDFVRRHPTNKAKEAEFGLKPGEVVPIDQTKFAFPDGTRPQNVFLQITNDTQLKLREPGSFANHLQNDAADYISRFGNGKVGRNIRSINNAADRFAPIQFGGAVAGIDPQTDENGNTTIGFDPGRAAAGMVGAQFFHHKFQTAAERDASNTARMHFGPNRSVAPGDPLPPIHGTEQHLGGLTPEEMFPPHSGTEPGTPSRPTHEIQAQINGMAPEDLFKGNAAGEATPPSLEPHLRQGTLPGVTQADINPPKGVTAGDWIRGVRYSGLLSSPGTLIRNVASGMYQLPRKVLVDMLSQSHGASTAELKGLFGGVGTALKSALDVALTGESARATDLESRIGRSLNSTLAPRTPLPGPLGKVINTVPNLLRSGDEFFHSLAVSAELGRLSYVKAEELSKKFEIPLQDAVQHILAMNDKDTVEAAVRVADKVTYRTPLTGMGKGLQELSRHPLGEFLVPFFHATWNIGATSVEELPVVGLLKRDASLSGSQQAASQALSMATAGAAGFLAMSGHISGAGPTDQQERDRLMRSGWQPYSIQGPDGKWYDYSNMGPLSATLSAVSNAYEASTDKSLDEKDKSERFIRFGKDFTQSMLDNTPARGVAQLFSMIDRQASPNQFDNWIAGYASQVIPFGGAINAATQAGDTLTRDPKGIGERIQARLGPLRGQLPAKLDAYGREIPNPGYGGGALLPFRTNLQTAPKADIEMSRLNIPVSKVDDIIGSAKIKLDRNQQQEYQRTAGGLLQTRVEDVMDSPTYKKLTDEQKTARLTAIKDYSNQQAQDSIVDPAVAKAKPKGEPQKYYDIDDPIMENRIDLAKAKVAAWKSSLKTDNPLPDPSNAEFDLAYSGVTTYDYKEYLANMSDIRSLGRR